MELSNSTVKTPEAETETPTRIQLPANKNSPFTNGVLKRHAPLHLGGGLHHPVVVTYKECLKNHAASLGGHAVDGCGEFMPSPATNPADPTSLKCSACGCHRNFHRRDPDESPPPLLLLTPPNAAPALEYRPHHRHHPPPPPPPPAPLSGGSSPNNSPSPPPISSSYYPSAPHMLLALSHGPQPPPDIAGALSPPVMSSSNSRKRFRTRFTQDQKDKMLELAEKVGWKMQKKDENVIHEYCSEIGVDKNVFKVWMHNNKNKKEDPLIQPHFSNNGGAAAGISNLPPAAAANGGGISYNAAEVHFRHQHEEEDCDRKENVLGTNGSSC